MMRDVLLMLEQLLLHGFEPRLAVACRPVVGSYLLVARARHLQSIYQHFVFVHEQSSLRRHLHFHRLKRFS